MRKELKKGFQWPSRRDCRIAFLWALCPVVAVSPIFLLFSRTWDQAVFALGGDIRAYVSFGCFQSPVGTRGRGLRRTR